MDFKFGKELIKALYKIRDAISGEKSSDEGENEQQYPSVYDFLKCFLSQVPIYAIYWDSELQETIYINLKNTNVKEFINVINERNNDSFGFAFEEELEESSWGFRYDTAGEGSYFRETNEERTINGENYYYYDWGG